VSHTTPPNAFGLCPSGLRLRPSPSAARTVHHPPLGGAIDMPMAPTGLLGGLNGCDMRIIPVRKSFLCAEPLRWPIVPHPWDGWGGGAEQRPQPNVLREYLPATWWQC
jgi:hypothetical protein